MVSRDFVMQLAARLVLFVVGLCSASFILVRFHPDLQRPDGQLPVISTQSTAVLTAEMDTPDTDRFQSELSKTLAAAVEGSAGTVAANIFAANSVPLSVGLRGGPNAHDQEGLSPKLVIDNYLAKIAETEVEAVDLVRYLLVAQTPATANENEILASNHRTQVSKITATPTHPFVKGSELSKPSIWSTFSF